MLHPEGSLRFRDNGLQVGETLVVGDINSIGPLAELQTTRIDRTPGLPSKSNASLSLKIRNCSLRALGSAVRVEWESEDGTNAAWLGFDDSRTPETEPSGLHYGPQRFEIADTSLAFRSFKAEILSARKRAHRLSDRDRTEPIG